MNLLKPNLLFVAGAFIAAFVFTLNPVRESILQLFDIAAPAVIWAFALLLSVSYAIAWQKEKNVVKAPSAAMARNGNPGQMTFADYLRLSAPVYLIFGAAVGITYLIKAIFPGFIEANPFSPLLWIAPLLFLLILWLWKRGFGTINF